MTDSTKQSGEIAAPCGDSQHRHYGPCGLYAKPAVDGDSVLLSAKAARHLINDGPCPHARRSAKGEAADLLPSHCAWCELAAALIGSNEGANRG